MAARHVTKDASQHAWEDIQAQVRLDLRKVVRRVEDRILTLLAAEFDQALQEGQILDIRLSPRDLSALVTEVAGELEA